MQPRRITTPPPSSAATLPSPSISDILHLGSDGLPSSPPTAADEAWATSPTQTLGHSSPELPHLPSLASLTGLPQTPPDNPADGDYYTASWGSPYPRPPPRSIDDSVNGVGSAGRLSPTSGATRASQREQGETSNSSDFDEDSSGLHFGLDHLLPARLPEELSPELQFGLEHLLPSRLLGAQVTPTTSRYQPIEDTPRPSEKAIWLSDESGRSDIASEHGNQDSAGSPDQTQHKKGHRSRRTLRQEDFWTHLSKPQQQQQALSKMMSSRYAIASTSPVKVVERPGNASAPTSPSRHSLMSRPSVDSLASAPPPQPQFTYEPQSPMLNEPRSHVGVREKPSVESLQQRAPRTKIVSKKGKTVWIALPADVERGRPGRPPKVLSPEEVQARFKSFEQAGYDTRGFGHWRGSEPSFGTADRYAQNRAEYPDPVDSYEPMRTKAFPVRVPNQALWKAYQDELVEMKLRALGVSLGDDEQAASPSPLSRQPSSQYPPLPFSPPLPTSSAGSMHRANGSIAIGAMGRGPSPGHMSRGSMASPLSSFGNPRGSMHMHRHSTFTSPSSFPGQPTPPGVTSWSPQQYFGPGGVARGGSPALATSLPGSRPDLSEIMSPSSPFGISPSQAFQFPPKDDLLAQMQQIQQQQQQLQAQLLQQQPIMGVRPASVLEEVPEDDAEAEEEEKKSELLQEPKTFKQPDADIVVPAPRGHRHNISQNLERGVQEADYHLEKDIDRQLNEGQFSPGLSRFGLQSSASERSVPNQLSGDAPVWEAPRTVEQVLHHPQPHARTHSLTQSQTSNSLGMSKHSGFEEDLSEEEEGENTQLSDLTNPSIEDDKRSSMHSAKASQSSSAWRPGHGSRASRTSISTLNADAKEFQFNPTASFKPGSFTPGSFSFGGFGSQPSSASSFKQSFSSVTQSFPPSDVRSTGLNFAAPSFQPGKSFTGNSLPTSEFSFSANAPSFNANAPSFNANAPSFKPDGFKPDAPVFKPEAPVFKPSFSVPSFTSSLSSASQDLNMQSSIFGNVNLSSQDIVKPVKRSKAIPIVRPDVTPPRELHEEDEHQEGADGRITQSDARQKRLRHVDDDGDSVPLFASPSQPLGEVNPSQTGKQEPQIERSPAAEEKENFVPTAAEGKAKEEEKEPAKPAGKLDVDTAAAEEEAEKVGGSDREEESSGTPIATRSEEISPTIEKGDGIDSSIEDEQPQRMPFQKHSSKGSLSATAKPFEPRFGASAFSFGGIHVTKPSVTQSTEIENVPASSPPRHVSQSPAHTHHTFRTDNSYRTAPELSRKQPAFDDESVDFDSLAQPSFNEIDEVMKHMNEEGSDFGVERDEEEEAASWDQSSHPRHSLGDFELHPHTDLRPTMQLRSDAPSPSPRRVYPQQLQQPPVHLRHLQESGSITQDPFDDENAALAYESPVRRLNNAGDAVPSDWDDVISSREEEDKFHSRKAFFDGHVDSLIEKVLHSKLAPMEENLRMIHDSLAAISTSRRHGGRREYSTERQQDSDADDEDDDMEESTRFRNRSPLRDRRLEKLKTVVTDAIAAHYQAKPLPVAPADATPPVPVEIAAPQLDLSEFHAALAELKNAVALQQQKASEPLPEPTPVEAPQIDLTELHAALAELKNAVALQQEKANEPVPAPVEAAKIDSADFLAAVAQMKNVMKEHFDAAAAREVAPSAVVQTPQPDMERGLLDAIAEIKKRAEEELRGMREQASVPAPQADLTEHLDAIKDVKSLMQQHFDEAASREIVAPTVEAPAIDMTQFLQEIATVKESMKEHFDAAAAARELAPAPAPAPAVDLTEFYQAFADMKVSMAKAASQHVQLDDFKELVEGTLARQQEALEKKNEIFKEVMKEALVRQGDAIERGRDDFKEMMEEAMARQLAAGAQDNDNLRGLINDAFAQQDAISMKRIESTSIMENEGRIAELEAQLKEARQKLEQEAEARKAIEKREGETDRLLKLTEQELGLLKSAVRDEENRRRALEDEVQVARINVDAHKTAQGDMHHQLDTLNAENQALQATLAEYRLSSNRWREEIEDGNAEREHMKKAAEALKLQIGEAVRIREVMRGKLDKLQQDMVAAAGSIAQEKAFWQKTDKENRTRYEVLHARLEAEARTRERLERELERLELQEREAMRLRVTLEQTQHANARLEETADALRLESQEHQKTAARYEREFREAREAGRGEVQRTRHLLEADVERANHEVNLVRSDLEAEVARVRAELDQVRLDADTARARHELMLEEEADKKKAAVQEVLEARKAALQDMHERHERRIEDLHHQHGRGLKNAHEDRERAEKHLRDQLDLAKSKLQHYEDKIQHLEERLSVSTAAAQAAVQAAQQSAKAAPAAAAPAITGHRSGPPEKISPQALRESIAVLQEQLQERETRIESLEHELSEIDKEAPGKLKERDTEIGWLRELLGVRVDDISDLITALAQPDFDRETVRDAAIRIRTNLQMEQQEKERLIAGTPPPGSVASFPSLTALSSLATPKAAQLAAAIGNWRRSGSTASTASRPQLSTSSAVRPGSRMRNHTPSKHSSPAVAYPPNSAQSFLTGLMTPPASNVRRTSPQPETPRQSQLRQQRHHNIIQDDDEEQPSAWGATGRRISPVAKGKQPLLYQSGAQATAPRTPPLLRKASYDLDAESANGFYDEDDEAVDDEGEMEESSVMMMDAKGGLERGWDFPARV